MIDWNIFRKLRIDGVFRLNFQFTKISSFYQTNFFLISKFENKIIHDHWKSKRLKQKKVFGLNPKLHLKFEFELNSKAESGSEIELKSWTRVWNWIQKLNLGVKLNPKVQPEAEILNPKVQPEAEILNSKAELTHPSSSSNPQMKLKIFWLIKQLTNYAIIDS